ncbi:Cof-type HAD-IIB family hydrolase [Staphylococcus debuckii]|uniref:Cof-type HAD-IIB family hydrolase n=1 Tax=Staphylococcus debuckii TaxID=2044912 RepID=UPI000F432969|nr:Cof-type HAD-IIB family hydrolase [Staphylococcus debuckii]AYU55146.1 HAD family phosphatase [Staphylococcus debuckii]
MTKYEMIIMDMDDTLLTSENEVSPKTAQYLINLQEQGYHVVLASGRPTEGMLPIAKSLKLNEHDSYVISYNGGRTTRVKDDELEDEQSVSKQDFDKIVDYCRENDLFILTYQDGHIIYEGEHEYMNIESELTGLPMKKVDDVKTFIQNPVPKAMGVDYVPHIEEIFQSLNGKFNDNVDVTTSKPYFLEFMAHGVSKGNALKALCCKVDIDISQTIAFGDSLNDYSMIEEAGYSVAMGNAKAELKEIADDVTLDHDSDGIVVALEKILK